MAILRSPKNLKGKIIEEWQYPAPLPSHLKVAPLQSTCTLARVCRKQCWAKVQIAQLSSLALCWQRRTSGSGRLLALYIHAISLSPRELFLVALTLLELHGTRALCWLGPLLYLLICLNFLALARKSRSYYAASTSLLTSLSTSPGDLSPTL